MKRIAVYGATAGLVVAVAACGQSGTTTAHESGTAGVTSSAVAEPAPGGPTITIAGMGFSGPLTVSPGAQVTIVNNDEVEHTVTSRTKGLFDVEIQGKHRAVLTAPSDPGDYTFYCRYHPGMISSLTVK